MNGIIAYLVYHNKLMDSGNCMMVHARFQFILCWTRLVVACHQDTNVVVLTREVFVFRKTIDINFVRLIRMFTHTLKQWNSPVSLDSRIWFLESHGKQVKRFKRHMHVNYKILDSRWVPSYEEISWKMGMHYICFMIHQ